MRGYRAAQAAGDEPTAEGWSPGWVGAVRERHDPASRGGPRDLDHYGALLRDVGHRLVLVLDQVDGGRCPGLYLLVTGTPAVFDNPRAVQLRPPALPAHRSSMMATFGTDPRVGILQACRRGRSRESRPPLERTALSVDRYGILTS